MPGLVLAPDARRREVTSRTRLTMMVWLLVWSLVASISGATPVIANGGNWVWPLSPVPEVAREFEKPPKNWLPGHRGVDLVATAGQEVRAPADGTVWFVGVVVDRPVLSIRHDNGVLTSYEPVTSELNKGDRVLQGEVIGNLAAQLHDARSAMHWGARVDGEYVNPLRFVLDLQPSVLLPWEG